MEGSEHQGAQTLDSGHEGEEYGSIIGDGKERLAALEITSGGQHFQSARIRTASGETKNGELFVDSGGHVVFRETEI